MANLLLESGNLGMAPICTATSIQLYAEVPKYQPTRANMCNRTEVKDFRPTAMMSHEYPKHLSVVQNLN
jgi:hypothetical protein